MNISIGNEPIHSKVTSEDVRKVRDYVREGLFLPIDDKGVEEKFDSINVGYSIEGISTIDLKNEFKAIRMHAGQWSMIEKQIRESIAELTTFSDDLSTYAQPALDEIKAMDGYKKYTLRMSEIGKNQIDKLVFAVESSYQTKQYLVVPDYVEAIAESIRTKKDSAGKVKLSLEYFKREAERVEGELGAMLNKASTREVTEELRVINVNLRQLADDIEGKKSLVSFDLMNFVTSLNGRMTAAQWKQYFDIAGPLIQEQARKLNRKMELDKLSGSLENIRVNVSSLKVFALGAWEGITQIDNLWSATITEIDESKQLLDKPDHWKLLFQFVIKMEEVISRWVAIKKDMGSLSKALN
jgi:hypothetical protein